MKLSKIKFSKFDITVQEYPWWTTIKGGVLDEIDRRTLWYATRAQHEGYVRLRNCIRLVDRRMEAIFHGII